MKNLFLIIILFLNFSLNAQDVTIGTQTWQAKNLNVSKYRNGDVIPQVQDKKAWSKLKTGAWCYYENKTENGTKYGKLYNWYAVNDKRGLAPKGYHIPTYDEWSILVEFLGGAYPAAKKMKSNTGWANFGNNYNGNGNNSSGFAGLPGGNHYNFGDFGQVGEEGYWWTSSEDATNSALSRSLNITNNNEYRVNFDENSKTSGYSVRCLKD